MLPQKQGRQVFPQLWSLQQPRGPPHVFRSAWCKPCLLLEPVWHSDPRRRAGRQVTFHVSPRPGQAPTSSQALCNHLLPHVQPNPHLSLTLCPLRKWGSVSSNLASALPKECLISLRRTHTQTHTLNLSQKYKKTQTKTTNQKPMQQRRGRKVHQLKGTYFADYAFQRFLFECLYPTMKKKKNPKSYSSSNQDLSPRLPPRLRRAVRALRMRAGAGGAGPRGPADSTNARPKQRPHRWLPTEKAAGCWYSTGEGKGPGARTSLLDKDRSFMINLGRFKYLLS